ncbi:APC family permease [Clostridium estertheticum]|uniref:APC family permease n=1 Tax=Clostridium estertheticum TaxID=238834 RepID=UPI001C7DDD37|nr:APC family permease [Clostridium estertheticum]MBX4266002.1 APC family permease [Clostridium estertheticum]MBX4268739.1 APC family permease [Clostridium estertheticum]WLC79064.1 APC family permease [Clostridium estertheticum]WLC90083.1 APC family permease [Clostridium estertheticum]
MENQGGQQVFKRTLKLHHLTLFGLAYLAPMIVYGIYGVISETTHGVEAGAYLASLVAMFFTALSYCHMVKAFPVAGSAYTYTGKAISPHLGFMVGWAVMLDYVFIPMAIWLIGASYFNAAFPSIPSWAFVLGFIFVTTSINIIGIKIGAQVNVVMVLLQLLVIGAFIAFSVKAVMHGIGTGTMLSISPFYNKHVPFGFVMAGASIACYSFLGFDAVSTFVEEAVDPLKNIPRAIILTTVIGGLIFIVATYTTHMAHPGYVYKDAGNAAFEIAKQVAPPIFGTIFLIGMIIAQFASGISAQASGARLMYAMGRDNVLPKKIFGVLSNKFNTPINNIIITGVIALLALKLTVATSTSFINFGAFTAFAFVNISVIVHYFIKGKRRSFKDTILFLIFPMIGASFCFLLLTNLDKAALTLGCIWATCGFIYLIFLTKGFKVSPPEMAAGSNDIITTDVESKMKIEQ